MGTSVNCAAGRAVAGQGKSLLDTRSMLDGMDVLTVRGSLR